MPKKLVKKLKSTRQLKRDLWKHFSLYIRQRDNFKCISCGKQCDKSTSDAGHFIPKTKGLGIYFDVRNVNAQCQSCNRWKHGNLAPYALALTRKYGPQVLEDLDKLANQTIKISREEYEELITHYKSLCK